MVLKARQRSRNKILPEQTDGASIEGDSDDLSADDIRRQLDRILMSSEFAIPDRARRVLRYIVEESLAGRADRIKAYSIAIEVFGRDESFDAQNDPVVRIEAGRIRRALERYYLLVGQSDPVSISIPKGGYVPLFERRHVGQQADRSQANPGRPAEQANRAWWSYGTDLFGISLLGAAVLIILLATSERPSMVSENYVPKVAVIPFANSGEDRASKDFAFGVTAEIVNQLARFKDIIVTTERLSAPSEGQARHPLQYELTGSVRAAGERIRVTVQLVKGEDKNVMWTEAYEQDLRVGDMLDMQKNVAEKVATTIGQPYGSMLRLPPLQGEGRHPDDFVAYSCTLRYFTYRAELLPAQHLEVRECLERAVERFPHYATAWALLSSIYLDEDRFRYNATADTPPALVRALEAARKAVALEPDNIRALQALMLAYFFNRDVASGLKTGEHALALNPNDMELLSEFGVRVALSGEWPKGSAMIERALALNPGNANYLNSVLAFGAYVRQDFVAATRLIEKVSVKGNGLFCLIAAAIYAQRGMDTQAQLAIEAYYATKANYLEHLDDELNKRNIPPADQALFVEGLRKAGFSIPGKPALGGGVL